MMEERMKKQILHAATLLMLAFGVLMAYVTYLMTFQSEALALHPLNPRSSVGEDHIWRGSLLDAKGRPLAESDLPGARSYPYGEMMAPVTGYFGETTGSAGLEGYANRTLLGITDEMERMGPVAQLFAADHGNHVRLTIDADVQQAAWDGLDGRRGAVVVLDADTGAVLALVSSPSFDPSDIEAQWDSLLQREDSPLLNRPLAGLYPPGSTIKPMIADIALEKQITDPGEFFECSGLLDVGGGYTIKESHDEAHGKLTLGEAIRESCNVTFGTLGMRLGGQGLSDGFHRFAFDRPLQGELMENGNHLPDFYHLDSGDLAQIGIGQSSLLVTPMHMALLAAAMVHGGIIMKPYMIDEVLSPSGAVLHKTQSEEWAAATTEERARMISAWMRDVVEKGTGTAAAVSDVPVFGKTGTAENPAGDDHAWFIGSAKLPERTIAFAVLVENGGEGGRTAAPIARDVMMSILSGN